MAAQIRHERLRQGYTQATMARLSGIPLRTYKRIELSGTGSIQNLIVILRTLDRIKAVGLLIPPPTEEKRISIVERINIIAEVAKKNRRS